MTGWRASVVRAIKRPAFAEPLEPGRLANFALLGQIIALLAIATDVGLWLALRGDPHIRASTLDAFAAINLPVVVTLFAISRFSLTRPVVSRLAVTVGVVASQASIVVWIQVTGSLSSYFMVAGAMLVATHRAMLSWRMGLVSLLALYGLHGGAFLLEEVGVLDPAPLFRAAPGPVYEAAAMRWSVIASILSIYVTTWMGANLLIATLRRTERALESAERRLAAAALGAREGRLTGQRVAGFRLLEVIGRGGMAEVYRGVPDGAVVTDRGAVAVKVVHPHLVDDEHLLMRARREASIAARLPASVTAAVREVHLAGPGERVVVLDHLEGEDLASLLRRRRRLPLDEAVALLTEICAVVDAVHAAGVIHRDLKPHNLFLLDDGGVRVLDFGVARSDEDRDAATQAMVVLGTPGYIAPEMLATGSTAVGPEADVFALGVIAYQLVTGERPFPADPAASTPSAIPPPSRAVPDLPVDVDAVLAIALARSPSRRYHRAGELAADLAHAVAGTLPSSVRARADATAGVSLDDTMVAARDAGAR